MPGLCVRYTRVVPIRRRTGEHTPRHAASPNEDAGQPDAAAEEERMSSVVKKRRKKMRKHKHRKMLKKTRWQRKHK